MSIDFSFFITSFKTIPSNIVLMVFIGMVGCLCLISASLCCTGMASLQLIYRAPSSAYAAEDITDLIICAIVRMTPLFGGSGESLDMKKCPLTLLIAGFLLVKGCCCEKLG